MRKKAEDRLLTGFKTEVDAGGEELPFVWRGAIQVKDRAASYSAGEKDTVFITGPAELEVSAAPAQAADVIRAQAPPVMP